jgi:hypothetical protein
MSLDVDVSYFYAISQKTKWRQQSVGYDNQLAIADFV